MMLPELYMYRPGSAWDLPGRDRFHLLRYITSILGTCGQLLPTPQKPCTPCSEFSGIASTHEPASVLDT